MTFLYLTAESVDPDVVRGRLGLGENETVSLAGTVGAAREALSSGVDCLLCDGRDGAWALEAVRALRRDHPTVPIVAFVGDRDGEYVDRMIRAGATDVVQSWLETASPSLVRTRIDCVLASTDGTASSRTGEPGDRSLDAGGGAIYQLDADGTLVAVNDATVELTGYGRSELIGANLSRFLSHSDADAVDRVVGQLLRAGDSQARTLSVDVTTKAGRTVSCRTQIAVVTAGGEPAGAVGVIGGLGDVSEHELNSNDGLLRDIGEASSDLIWVKSAEDGHLSFVSAAYEEIWGRPVAELYERPRAFLEGVHPDDRDRVREALSRQRTEPDAYDETYRVVRPDGEIRWVHDRAFGVYEAGSLERIVGVAQDITERKRAQEQLAEERDMFAEGPAIVFRWRNAPGWPVEYVSENVEDVLGYAPEDFESGDVPYTELLLEEELERISREVADNSDDSTERFSHDPYRLRTSDGDVRWVKDMTKIVRDDDGDITHYQGYLVDITERKEREGELERLKEEYEVIFENVRDSVFLIDVEDDETFRYARVNANHYERTGLSPDDIEGREPRDVLGEEAGTEVAENYRECLRRREPISYVETLDLPGSERTWRTKLAPVIVDGEVTQIVGVSTDITERKRRAEKIEAHRNELAQLNRLNAVIRDVDQALLGASSREEIEETVCQQLTDSGHYEFALALRSDAGGRLELSAWTGVGAEYAEGTFPLVDRSTEDSPGLRALETGDPQTIRDLCGITESEPWQSRAVESGIESLAAIPVEYEGTQYGVLAVYDDEPDAFGERELAVLGELGETVGYAIAAVERREREATLTSLYEATRDLLGVETQGGVSEVVVDAAAEVLDIDGVGVFLFDDADSSLEPVAATDTLLQFYEESAVFGPGDDSEVWYSYVTGEERFFADVRESERLARPQTDARSALFVPLANHGVFVAAADEIGAIDDQKRQLVGLLAATAEAALDRVAGKADIRERDAELAAQTRRLEQLERVVDFVRDMERVLVDAGSREEIEQAVCDRLIEVDPYGFAWIGTVPPDGDRVEPRAWAGTEDGYLDEAPLALSGTEPAARTAADGSVSTVSNVTDHLRESEWAQVAVDAGYQSAIAVPLTYGKTTYGVLAVYAVRPDAFDETSAPLLADLGELIAYGVNTVETRRGVLSERVTEVELHIENADTFLNAVSRVTGEPVTYREILPDGDGSARVLFALDDPAVEDVLDLESAFVAVDSLSHVERGDEHLFRATLTGQTVAGVLLKCGGIPREVVASAEETTALVTLPRELDVRVFLERVRETYPDVTLVSRRDVERRDRDRADVRAALEERLTERQREVLLTAYESGFFESPRKTTGAELAELLGVSQPTVTHHLREAQRRLFAAIYGDGN